MVQNQPPVRQRKIFKVLFFTRDHPPTDGTIQIGEAIEHAGHIWLVPLWHPASDGAGSVPARLVRLSGRPAGRMLEKLRGGRADYLLKYPLPLGDFLGEAPPRTPHGFTVIEKPSLKIVRRP